jgi:hypothetical protein
MGRVQKKPGGGGGGGGGTDVSNVKVGIIGDSLTQQNSTAPGGPAITAALVAQGYTASNIRVDGLQGRFVDAPSPAPTSVDVMNAWKAAGFSPDVLVVALGTNDACSALSSTWSSAWDAFAAARRSILPNVKTLLWVNVAGDTTAGADGTIGTKGNTAAQYNSFLYGKLQGLEYSYLDWNGYVKTSVQDSTVWQNDSFHVHMTDAGYAIRNSWLAAQIRAGAGISPNYPFRSGAWVNPGGLADYRNFGTARGRDVDIAHYYITGKTSWSGLAGAAGQLAKFSNTEFQFGYRLMISIPPIPNDASATCALIVTGANDAQIDAIFDPLIANGFNEIIIRLGWEENIASTYYGCHPSNASVHKATGAELIAAKQYIIDRVKAKPGGGKFRWIPFCPVGTYGGVAASSFRPAWKYIDYAAFDLYLKWFAHSNTTTTTQQYQDQWQYDIGDSTAVREGAQYHADLAAANGKPVMVCEWGEPNPAYQSDGGVGDNPDMIDFVYGWFANNCTPPGAPYQGGECYFEADLDTTTSNGSAGNFKITSVSAPWMYPKPLSQARYFLQWPIKTGGSGGGGGQSGPPYRYDGNTIWGGLDYQTWAASLSAIQAAGGTLNAKRIYRSWGRGEYGLTAANVADHNAGAMLVVDMNCVGANHWDTVPTGAQDAHLKTMFDAADALNFGVVGGKQYPTHIVITINHEHDRALAKTPANKATAQTTQAGITAAYKAFHRYIYNYLRSNYNNPHILIGWCTTGYGMYTAPTTNANVGFASGTDRAALFFPGIDVVDVVCPDPYDYTTTTSQWIYADGWEKGFKSWSAKNLGGTYVKQWLWAEWGVPEGTVFGTDKAAWWDRHSRLDASFTIGPVHFNRPDTNPTGLDFSENTSSASHSHFVSAGVAFLARGNVS